MQKLVSLRWNRIMLFLIVLSSNLACCALVLAPALTMRTLRIHPNLNEFYYQYEICTKKFLGTCLKKELTQDHYEFSNKEKMKQLKDMGFVLVVEKNE
jgi:hypothetical protein